MALNRSKSRTNSNKDNPQYNNMGGKTPANFVQQIRNTLLKRHRGYSKEFHSSKTNNHLICVRFDINGIEESGRYS